MQINKISKIYAKALYDSDIDINTLISQLDNVLNTIDSSVDLQNILGNYSVPNNKKNEILEEIFKNKIDDHLINLLKILIDNNRISELKGIHAALLELNNKTSNRKRVEIISSIELDNDTKQKIVEKLNKKLNCTVLPAWQIDKDIIAGLVFRYDDFVIDTSVQAKLKQLSKL